MFYLCCRREQIFILEILILPFSLVAAYICKALVSPKSEVTYQFCWRTTTRGEIHSSCQHKHNILWDECKGMGKKGVTTVVIPSKLRKLLLFVLSFESIGLFFPCVYIHFNYFLRWRKFIACQQLQAETYSPQDVVLQ